MNPSDDSLLARLAGAGTEGADPWSELAATEPDHDSPTGAKDEKLDSLLDRINRLGAGETDDEPPFVTKLPSESNHVGPENPEFFVNVPPAPANPVTVVESLGPGPVTTAVIVPHVPDVSTVQVGALVTVSCYRGSPSILSAMMLRFISEVPISMVAPRDLSMAYTSSPPSIARGDPLTNWEYAPMISIVKSPRRCLISAWKFFIIEASFVGMIPLRILATIRPPLHRIASCSIAIWTIFCLKEASSQTGFP